MAVMMQRLYDALRSAGSEEEKAQSAAVEMGQMWARILRIEIVLGFNTALQIAIFVKLFTS